MTKREFRLENEYRYNRSGPVRWIVSHTARYPVFPLAMLLAAVLNNTFYSYIQVFVGQGFDLITKPGWSVNILLSLALSQHVVRPAIQFALSDHKLDRGIEVLSSLAGAAAELAADLGISAPTWLHLRQRVGRFATGFATK